MAGLLQNPLGDLNPSLHRIESAVVDLRGDMDHIQHLPTISAELKEVNASLTQLIELIEGLRGDLVTLAASR